MWLFIDGYNSCIMAYGQTGSGKTFTMVRIIFDALRKDDKCLMIKFRRKAPVHNLVLIIALC
jgi:KaiC/GvpD/RAD55 family RecA-like ATPase